MDKNCNFYIPDKIIQAATDVNVNGLPPKQGFRENSTESKRNQSVSSNPQQKIVFNININPPQTPTAQIHQLRLYVHPQTDIIIHLNHRQQCTLGR